MLAAFAVLGSLIFDAVKYYKDSERTVIVKGLSERDVKADTAIFPITFKALSENVSQLYDTMEKQNSEIVSFLLSLGFAKEEIGFSSPKITDRRANFYGENFSGERYLATATIIVYTNKVDLVLDSMRKLGELGKKGIVIAGDEYGYYTDFMYANLNDIKPSMIEEATKNARSVAEKFASDSGSKLGKIKSAQQGQFTITNRDQSTAYIKNVRVVSTIEYYLAN